MEIDDIYSDIIMAHANFSPYKKELENATCSVKGHNPNCGDEIAIQIKLDGNRIADMAFTGSGCAISQSSTSVMIETLKGKTLTQAKKILNAFFKMIRREELTKSEQKMLGNALAFENISNMPARVKCALLAWHTIEDTLNGN